eukprot:scaffold108883_cov20-Prasinocladus_malaysianus.AAC.1
MFKTSTRSERVKSSYTSAFEQLAAVILLIDQGSLVTTSVSPCSIPSPDSKCGLHIIALRAMH